jgi:hypothetical protein
VVLIRELNLNIGKVVELYRELSVRCGCACVLVSRCRVADRRGLPGRSFVGAAGDTTER